MLCPKCNNPMHNSSIGLLVCLKCGNTLQPSEANAYNPNLPPDQQNQALQPEALYSKDPFAAPMPSLYNQANNPAASVAYANNYTPPPLESYLEGVPGQTPASSTSAVILSKLASATPKQKKLALALLSLVFIASILGGFFGYNDYQTTKTLKQGMAQDQQGKFDDAILSTSSV